MKYVVSLIGQQAGDIIEMPAHAAEACISNGTARLPTEAELQEWLDSPKATPRSAEVVERLIEGFETRRREDGQGYDLFVRDSEKPLNDAPLANLVQARDLAARVSEAAGGGDPVDIPGDWEDLGLVELRALAQKIDPRVKTNNQATAAIKAELKRRAEATSAT